ncbi:MAG TPA: YggS family pyridoxal phosphate-dependent enzyme [Desulfobacteraceae bacterium]|nr:YggS family pyridoxal phosphate-dependent enzyme [Desulfobacteraceae bacterium]
MTAMKERILNLKEKIKTAAQSVNRNPDEISLVGVSKRKPAETVARGIDQGLEILGENYIQEAMDKIDAIGRTRARWHFIGHLQSNKAKYAVGYFDLIHTVDKFKLAKEIDKQAGKIGKVQEILMQVNISEEASKSGASAEDALELAQQIGQLDNLSLRGLMCMPPFFDDPEQARPYFKALAGIKKAIQERQIPGIAMDHLSMGMSHDFTVAIEEGATLVRVGTAIFGARD